MITFSKRVMSIALLFSLFMQTSLAEIANKTCCKPHNRKKHEKNKRCKPGADITKLGLTTVNITVNQNYPDDGQTMNLVAKYASQNTGGKDVLFLHGFPHCHLLWKNQLADHKLRKHYNLYTLDFRGQGESDKPAPSAPPAPDGTDTVYRPWQNYANDIHQTIVQLGLNKPVLVAHSLGAVFLNDYLRMYGDTEISGILIVSGLPDAVLTLSTLTLWASPDFLALESTGATSSTNLEQFIPGTQAFAALSEEGSSCKLTQKDLQEVLMYDTYVPGPIRNAIVNHNGLPPVGSGLPSPNDDVWATVSVPTTIVHGVKDNVILFDAGVHLKEVIPNASLRPFKHSGHFLVLQQSHKFNKELLKFLKQL